MAGLLLQLDPLPVREGQRASWQVPLAPLAQEREKDPVEDPADLHPIRLVLDALHLGFGNGDQLSQVRGVGGDRRVLGSHARPPRRYGITPMLYASAIAVTCRSISASAAARSAAE